MSEVKSIDLKLRSGMIELVRGSDFHVISDVPYLTYTEKGIWHVVSDPEAVTTVETKIFIPTGFAPEYMDIALEDCAFIACPVSAGRAAVDIKSSGCEFRELAARRVSVVLRRGRAVMNVFPQTEAVFDCGFGDMLLRLRGTSAAYRISAERGAGSITIGSVTPGRSYRSDPGHGASVFVRCGLGNVRIT